jgi:enterochelin esterase-like enzyme
VSLRGEWQSAEIPMTNENGTWSVTVGPLPREVYAYSFSVDGLTLLDPQNTAVKLSARGATQSIVAIPGDPPGLHDARDVPHGTVQENWYHSKTLGLRHFFVYVPPGYDARTAGGYPVLVLLHGAGNAESNWVSMGRANFILDNLIAERAARPMLLVMPFGHAVPQGAANESENNLLFEQDLVTDIMPAVEARYNVAKGAVNRGVAGLSMGGMQALALGLRQPDRFGWVGVFSPIVERDLEQRYASQLADAASLNKKLSLVWVGCGTEDQLFKGTQTLHQVLEARGLRHEYRTGEGRHSWVVWRRHLAELAPLLFQRRR